VCRDRAVGVSLVELHIDDVSFSLWKLKEEPFQDFMVFVLNRCLLWACSFSFNRGKFVKCNILGCVSRSEGIKKSILGDPKEPSGKGDTLPLKTVKANKCFFKNF